MNLNMKVIFLCAGVGKRMFPITEDKFLLNFMGRTLLEHQIKIAMGAGLIDFLIIGNPGNIERIKALTASVKGATFNFAVQTHPRGIADALKCAATHLSGGAIIVNPNDVFESSAYGILLEEYRSGSASSYILGYQVRHYFPGGYLVTNNRGELMHIIEKPERGKEPSDLVNILLHLHTDMRKLLEYIDTVQTTRDDAYECAIDLMVHDSYRIKVVRYGGFWAPIKYPWNVFEVVRFFLDSSKKNIAASASVSDNATLSGKVIIGDNVRILENAVIRGPVYIGDNCIVGNNALVREYSHIGTGCVVGFSTEVKGSYIGNDCWFHSSYIGDSIIGNNCSFGAGTVTANFRFDEKDISVRYNKHKESTGRNHFGAIIGDNCKTGINSGILPGRRIGPNSIVGSHVCVTDDLEPGMILSVRPQSNLIIKPLRKPGS